MTDNRILYRSTSGYRALMSLYSATLSRWPVPYECRVVPTRHGDTHMIESGSTALAPLLLLCGSGTNATRWLPNIQDLSSCWRCYAIDGIGETGRSAPNRPSLRGPAYGTWLLDVLDTLKLERAHIIGISQGGWQALKLAQFAPERVDRVVALSTAGLVRMRLPFLLHDSLARLWPRRDTVRRLIRFIMAPDLPIDERVVEEKLLIYKYFRPFMQLPPVFAGGELSVIHTPVLLLYGEHDRVYDLRALTRRVGQLPPNFRLQLVPGAGHAVSADQPDKVFALVCKFLEESPTSSSKRAKG